MFYVFMHSNARKSVELTEDDGYPLLNACVTLFGAFSSSFFMLLYVSVELWLYLVSWSLIHLRYTWLLWK